MTDDGDIFAAVHRDLAAREARGAAEYGNAVMRAGDGRDGLWDAYEEALDMCVYLCKAIDERDAERAENAALRESQEALFLAMSKGVAELQERLAKAEAVCEEWDTLDQPSFAMTSAYNAWRDVTRGKAPPVVMGLSCVVREAD